MSADRQTELERFKTEINLSEYAAHVGFVIDKRQSSNNNIVMTAANGQKINIKRKLGGTWVYIDPRNPTDAGTIIDFIRTRDGINLGELRKQLRPWIGESSFPIAPRPAAGTFAADVAPVGRDREGVKTRLLACEVVSFDYLAGRGINLALQTGPRFQGTILRDPRRNTIFPHRDTEGVCGFEIKNAGFTGFAKGGEKGLWCSRAAPGDQTAVFAETAIDALSYAMVHGTEQTRFFSTAGALNPSQPDLIRAAVLRLPEGATVILAFDNDPGGDSLCESVAGSIGEKDGRVSVIERRPPVRGQDWNDALTAENPTVEAC